METFILYTIIVSILFIPLNFFVIFGLLKLFKLKNTWKKALIYSGIISFLYLIQISLGTVSEYLGLIFVVLNTLIFIFTNKEKKVRAGILGFIWTFLSFSILTAILGAVLIPIVQENLANNLSQSPTTIRDLVG